MISVRSLQVIVFVFLIINTVAFSLQAAQPTLAKSFSCLGVLVDDKGEKTIRRPVDGAYDVLTHPICFPDFYKLIFPDATDKDIALVYDLQNHRFWVDRYRLDKMIGVQGNSYHQVIMPNYLSGAEKYIYYETFFSIKTLTCYFLIAIACKNEIDNGSNEEDSINMVVKRIKEAYENFAQKGYNAHNLFRDCLTFAYTVKVLKTQPYYDMVLASLQRFHYFYLQGLVDISEIGPKV